MVAGTLKAAKSPLYAKFEKLLGWADEVRKLGVRANADIPRDAKVAFAFGARGIGLCRTEHMFFAADRLALVVKMILSAARGQKGIDLTRRLKEKLAEARGSQAAEVRKEIARVQKEYGKYIADYTGAIAKLLPMQRADFAGLFREMHGHPGHHPHPRPAAARVPAQAGGADGADRDPGGEGRVGEPARRSRAPGEDAARGRGAARVQPHARPPRLPPRHHLPGDHAHAGAGDLRGRGAGRAQGDAGQARGDDPARRPRRGAAPPGGHRPRGRGRGAGQGAGGRRSSIWWAP